MSTPQRPASGLPATVDQPPPTAPAGDSKPGQSTIERPPPAPSAPVSTLPRPEEGDWFYTQDRQKLGPFSWEQFRCLAAEGQIQPASMVWRQGTSRWLPAAEVPGLFTAKPVPSTSPAGPLPVIPGYEILGVLGKGGMGVVYKARQKSLGRLVALKMIRAGAYADDAELARFQAEAEAVARLQHPGIVPIYEVGTHAGQPFFALEYVEGGSLGKTIQGMPGAPRPAAQTALALARAVHHAHQHGIIHRDLKPANVLVTRDGTLKVTDFGLAKRLHGEPGGSTSGDLTQTGAIVGTTSYMAPEQAAGQSNQVGPAADVYALGAILYELLTGRTPFQGGTVMATVLLVLTTEPVRPARLSARVPRDLETVCLKCLHKEPGRRYPSAEALAEDLARFLNGEPIQARPVGHLERSWYWCRRHPARAALAGMAVLVAVAVVALFLGARAGQVQRQQALSEAEQLIDSAAEMVADRQYRAARSPLLQAQTLLRQYSADSGPPDRMERLLAQVDAHLRFEEFQTSARAAEYHLLGSLWQGVSEDGKPVGRPVGSRRGANLGKGIEQARSALKALRLLGPDASARTLARQKLDPGEFSLARARAAEVLLLLALALERQAGGKAALLRQAVAHLRLAQTLDGRSVALYENRARLLRSLGRKEEAAADEDKAKRSPVTFLDYHLQAGALHRRGQWTQAALAFQSALTLRPDEYWTLFRLAKVLENQRRYHDAENLFRACIALRPADPTAYNNRGTVLLQQRKWSAAAEAFEAALVRDPDYSAAYGNLMLAHAESKQVAQAEKAYRRYLERKPPDRRQHAWALNSLGLAYERAGRFDEALKQYDAALKHDDGYALAHRNRALVLARKHHDRAAERAIRRAIALEPKDGGHRYVLGNLFAGEGRYREARQAYTDAIERSPKLWDAWYNRGILARRERNHEDALDDLSRALALSPNNPEVLRERALTLALLKQFAAALDDVRRLDATHGEKGEVRRLRGKILGDMGHFKESEAELTEAIQEAPQEPDGYRSRAVTRLKAGRWQGAIDDFKQYLKRASQDEDVASIYNDLSVAYLNLGEQSKAVGALKDALAALNKAVNLRPTPRVLTNRGNFFLRMGNPALAALDFGAALRLDRTFLRAWALRGQAWLRLGKYADAVSDLTRALELERRHYETLLFHALACHLAGDDRGARTSLAKVIRDRPDHVRAKFARGMLHFLGGEWAQAVAGLSRAEDDEVLQPWVLLLRSRAWLKIGGLSLPAALADAAARVELLPNDGLAHLLAARVYALILKEASADPRERLRRRALELLERAVKRQPDLARGLAADPELEPLRKEPRFLRLVPER